MTEPTQKALPRPATRPSRDAEPEPKTCLELIVLGVIVSRFRSLALIAAVPLAWGWGLGWSDMVIAVVFYVVTGPRGHRRRTTGTSRTARSRPSARCGSRWRIAGGLSIEMRVDRLGGRPPPAPQVLRQGGRPALAVALRTELRALAKGLLWAHMGWLFDSERTNREKFAPTWSPTRTSIKIAQALPRAGRSSRCCCPPCSAAC